MIHHLDPVQGHGGWSLSQLCVGERRDPARSVCIIIIIIIIMPLFFFQLFGCFRCELNDSLTQLNTSLFIAGNTIGLTITWE